MNVHIFITTISNICANKMHICTYALMRFTDYYIFNYYTECIFNYYSFSFLKQINCNLS